MSHGTKQDVLKGKARQAFLKEERVQQSEQRVIEEAQRQAFTSAKTAKLRALREARDASEREATAAAKAAPEAKKTRRRTLP